jgi:4-amino-4-deoxy-L-arabinose transferase-like glycosyltransferase
MADGQQAFMPKATTAQWPTVDAAAADTQHNRRARDAWRARLWPHRWAFVLLVAHFVLSVITSVIVPPWEAHDEWAHYKFAEYLARERALPPVGVRLTDEYTFDEATQPPLYYALTALVVALIDTGDGLRPVVNPFATSGTGEGGVNMAIHDPVQERWPWQGTILALHLARLMSVVIGTLALLSTYGIARLLARAAAQGDDPSNLAPLLALAVAAFSPQWLFINSVVTNDVLVAALGGAVLYCAVRLVLLSQMPMTAPGWWKGQGGAVVGLAVSLGLALLTKYTALALLPVALLALLIAAVGDLRRQRRFSWQLAASLSAFAAIVVALAGWYFWHNLRLTGMLTTRDAYAEASFWQRLSDPGASVAQGLAWQDAPAALAYGFRTFWASFGWGNVEAASWVYGLWTALTLLGLVGFGVWLWRVKSWTVRLAAALMLAQVVCVVALPLYRELLHGEAFLRGRYLLPALPAVSVIIGLGLEALSAHWRPMWRTRLAGALIVGLGLLALAVPFLWIAPVYARPPQLTGNAAPLPHSLRARYSAEGGDVVEIVGYDLWPPSVAPGQGLAVTVDWRVLRRPAALAATERLDSQGQWAAIENANYVVGLHLVGRDGQSLGSVAHYPGRGNLASSIWQPGDHWRETFWLPVEATRAAGLPALGQVHMALFQQTAQGVVAYLPAVDATGAPLGDTVVFGRVRIGASPDGAAPFIEPAIVFGDPAAPLAGLADYQVTGEMRPGGRVTVALDWLALAPGQTDLTAFVQVLDADNRWVVGSDGPPDPQYPTGLWQVGDRIASQTAVNLPADLPVGDYRLVVGLYDAAADQRMPAFASGQRLPSDAAVLMP